MSYRPITDVWILARSKVAYYGAYPAGFLGRARQLLGITTDDPLLHVCGGMVKSYPFYGIGPNDRTVDLDPKCSPDFNMDVREIGRDKGDSFPLGCMDGRPLNPPEVRVVVTPPPPCHHWPAILIDRPYTEEDAEHYLDGTGGEVLPNIDGLLKRCLSITRPGGRVGVLDYYIPRPPRSGVRFVACIGVIVGFGNRGRFYTVYENDPKAGKQKEAPELDGDDEETPTAAAPVPAPPVVVPSVAAPAPVAAPVELTRENAAMDGF